MLSQDCYKLIHMGVNDAIAQEVLYKDCCKKYFI